jgi:LDH2 family malate/lactate/ureidoglycolate dehydrogenase
LIHDIKSSAKRPGFNEILLPGEPEWIEKERARKEGVYLDDPWWMSIVKTAKELGIDVDTVMKS